MKFSVATNFQDDFFKKINKKDIYEIFGKLTVDCLGGGRASYVLPSISKKRLLQHVKEAHESGIRFNYLLNAVCLAGREFTSQGEKEIRNLLDWLENIEVDSITITLPFLVKLIKKKYPRFKVCASLYTGIDNLCKAKYWEDMGVDLLTLESPILNRNFGILSKIRKCVKCKLQLIANNGCLSFCPFSFYHALLTTHASQRWNKYRNSIIDYCILACKYMKLKEPVNFIRSDWIRPEDVHYYEEIGIDSLKLVERTKFTDAISLAVDAYTNRSYNGNLADLIPSYSKGSFAKSKKGFFWVPNFHLKTFSIKLVRKSFKIHPEIEVYIDNRVLDGFLDFFIQGKCNQVCNECNYCYKVAERSVKIGEDYRQQMIKKYETVLYNTLFPI